MIQTPFVVDRRTVIISSLLTRLPETRATAQEKESDQEASVQASHRNLPREPATTNSFRFGLLATSLMGVVLLLHLLLTTMHSRSDGDEPDDDVYLPPKRSSNESSSSTTATKATASAVARCSATVAYEGCTDPLNTSQDWNAYEDGDMTARRPRRRRQLPLQTTTSNKGPATVANDVARRQRWFYFARGGCWSWDPRRPLCLSGRNRFRNMEQCSVACERSGADVRSRLDCGSPVRPRRCDVLGSRVYPYYYDWVRTRCLHHRGRSCLLAPNRFRSFVHCNRSCAECPQCSDERCSAAILSGDCSLDLKAFQAYFDSRAQTCRPWTDICLAAPNRFSSEQECLRQCLDSVTPSEQ